MASSHMMSGIFHPQISILSVLFLNPLWLTALVPWAGLVVWSLIRRGTSVDVPFVRLWQGATTSPKRRGVQLPPFVVLLFLLAMLFAIVGAASPVFERGGTVAVIVDRGVTMSVDRRYASAFEKVRTALARRNLVADVRWVPAYTASNEIAPPTAVDTGSMLMPAVVDASRSGSVVIVTDQKLAIDNDDIIRISPASPADHVYITKAAASVTSTGAQVMASLFNDSANTEVQLIVASGESKNRSTIKLPPRGQRQNYFVDIRSPGTGIEISVGDGLGQTAWLARRQMSPSIEIIGPVPQAVVRVVKAYREARPAAVSAPVVTVTTTPSGGDRSEIVVSSESDNEVSLVPDSVEVSDDPKTRDVNWQALIRAASVRGRPPAGWRPLVKAGAVVLAVEPSGQGVWTGLTMSEQDSSVDWVVMWTRLFDQLADTGTQTFEASRPQRLSDNWTQVAGSQESEKGYLPGFFRHSAGRCLAINVPDVRPAYADPTDVASLARLRPVANATTNLAPGCMVAAIGAILAGFLRLSGRNRINYTNRQMSRRSVSILAVLLSLMLLTQHAVAAACISMGQVTVVTKSPAAGHACCSKANTELPANNGPKPCETCKQVVDQMSSLASRPVNILVAHLATDFVPCPPTVVPLTSDWLPLPARTSAASINPPILLSLHCALNL